MSLTQNSVSKVKNKMKISPKKGYTRREVGILSYFVFL